MKNEKRKRSRNSGFVSLIIFLLCPHVTAFGFRSQSSSRRFAASTKHQPFLRFKKETDRDDRGVDRVPVPVISQRQRQTRRKAIDRKPRYFWFDPTNLRNELLQFWSKLGIATNHTSPTIPNESLLVYYERHDIRAAIVKNGGRAAVSILLNHAPIMPGRWKDAIASSIELQQLLRSANETNLRADRPPWTNKTAKETSLATSFLKSNNDTKLWTHHDGRNQKGHWNLQTVIQDLYVSIS